MVETAFAVFGVQRGPCAVNEIKMKLNVSVKIFLLVLTALLLSGCDSAWYYKVGSEPDMAISDSPTLRLTKMEKIDFTNQKIVLGVQTRAFNLLYSVWFRIENESQIPLNVNPSEVRLESLDGTELPLKNVTFLNAQAKPIGPASAFTLNQGELKFIGFEFDGGPISKLGHLILTEKEKHLIFHFNGAKRDSKAVPITFRLNLEYQ